MVDQNKRTTLKTMTAAATVAAVPAAIAIAATPMNDESKISAVSDIQTHMSGPGLQIELEPIEGKSTMWVRFSNASNNAVSLKHISPGLIRSDGQLYDVNVALNGETLTIESGNAYSYMIEPINDELDALVHRPDSKISPLSATVTGPGSPAHGDVLTPRLILS